MSEYLVGPHDSRRVVDRYTTFSGELAFDIGANRGWLANLFAEQFATVVACEPYPGSYEKMVETASPNVKPLNIAVSDVNGEIQLEVREETEELGQLFTPGEELEGWGQVESSISVPALTLDVLSELYGQPDFIKIDTEGHEVLIMDGGLATFAQGPQFLIEVHSRRNGDTVYMILRKLGLDFDVIRHRQVPVPNGNWYDHYWFASPR
jgi:FkbM family methyltransferase